MHIMSYLCTPLLSHVQTKFEVGYCKALLQAVSPSVASYRTQSMKNKIEDPAQSIYKLYNIKAKTKKLYTIKAN